MAEKLAIAMSGGVDSSVALVLLKDKYEVSGYTLKLHDSRGTDDSGLCGSASDIEDAKAIAAKFGVPHYLLDMRDLFSDTVQKSFVQSYLSGRTPNPCVECNETIKFGALLDAVKKQGINHIATGHYVRSCYDEKSGRWLLKKAINADGTSNAKDQSYVLYRLSQQQLAASVFPLGEMTKDEIRHIAADSGLINSDKPDSQDICFVPDGDYAGFIERYTGNAYPDGDFLDENGNVIGRHKGVIFYTIGQRRGIGTGFGKPMYVIGKNADNNTVTLGSNELLFTDTLYADNLNWIAFEYPESEFKCKAKTRYRQTEQPCTVYPQGGNTVRVVFDEKIRAVTPGQHVVFYDGDIVLGGGVIMYNCESLTKSEFTFHLIYTKLFF